MRERKINFIDLFAGAGGFSEGFINAGCTPIAHVEMNQNACDTLRTRACYHFFKQNDMISKYHDYLKGVINRDEMYELVPREVLDSVIHETMSESSMDLIYERIDKAIKFENISRVDLIIGGPPCQAYSQVGRSRKCMDNDPRNSLYKLYCKTLEKYKPEMFVFENVPGLVTAGNGKYITNIQNAFKAVGYELKYEIVNASDFGVLQRRKRIILIGWKHDSCHSYPIFEKKASKSSVSDILSDLSKIQAGESCTLYSLNNYSDFLKENGIRTDDDVLTWHIARNHIDRDQKIYIRAIEEWNNNHRRLKYSDLPDELSTHKNKSSFLDRYKVVAVDLPTSHTMMAHISKDGHYYIHPDIEQARSITVREAARIQSFPDSYFFEGSRTAAFTQIGNAVPPLMAKGIAEALIGDL
ncbi:MAG: DNA cytosine methyltransferase [Saccharofermentanales bacterium]